MSHSAATADAVPASADAVTAGTPTAAHGHRRTALLAVVALVLGLFAALFGGAASASAATVARSTTPARTSTETDIGRSVLNLLNRERAAHHLPALSMDSHLLASARNHDLAMARTNTMSHQCSGETDLGTRETRAGYKWSWAGENIGWNSRMDAQGVLQLEQMMYSEQPPNDGHRLNILNSHFKNIGVDVYMDNTHHKVWLTTDFGRH